MLPENIEQPKKSFLKRFWWIGAIVAVLLIGWGAYGYFSFVANEKMDSGLVGRAEQALNLGIAIDDEAHDFADMGLKDVEETKKAEKPNNPKAYDFPYLDIKSAQAGIDNEYLYFKVQFRGIIPGGQPEINGDKLIANGIKINLVNEKGEDQVIFLMNYDLIPIADASLIGTYYMYGPTGIEEPEDSRFSKKDHDSKVFGGPGTDYLLGALPFKKVGLKKGQMIYFTVAAEGESKKYDHAAVDVVGGQGKMPSVIQWKSGTKEFEVIDDFYFKNYEKLK